MTSPLPPGPRTWHPLGSFPAFRRDVLGFLTRMVETYGNVCSFRVGPMRLCIVNEPSLIEEILVRQHEHMIKHWDLRQLRFLLGRGLLTNEGAHWQRQRRIIQPAFHNQRVDQYAQRMIARATALSEQWRPGAVRDLHADMMTLTLGIVADTLFGADLSHRVRDVSEPLDRVMHDFEKLLTGWIPLPMGVPTPGNLKTRRTLARLNRVVHEIIALRRARTGGDDLLGWLLESRDEDGQAMDDRQLRDEVVTLILAGHETTAIALSWTFFLLAKHPEVADRLRHDLDAALGAAPVTAGVLSAVPYVRQVVQEALRLYPPVWAFGREPVIDLELGGYRIPRGTQLLLLAYVTQRDVRFFDDPLAFRPERWANDWRPPKYSYYPFGGGPRYCVGSNFALMEAALLLAILARRWRFELVPEHPVEVQATVTLRPRFGIMARLHQV